MTIRLAFLPLTDSAPLVAAKEFGFFERHALDVALSREPSWASVRDKIQTGRVEGAQTLATMPLSLSLGITHDTIDIVTGLVLSLNGNAITFSETLCRDLEAAGYDADSGWQNIGEALRAIVARRKSLGKPRLCFATVYLTSTHSYVLRYWLASIGILPDVDIRLVVIPPPRMVESLDSGLIDGCCVGEPWNHRAHYEGAGRIILTSNEVWANAPEKVLAVRRDWLEANPADHLRLTMALIEACEFLEQPANRDKMATVLARPDYLGLPDSVIRHSLDGQVLEGQKEEGRWVSDFHVFSRYAANFPWLSHAEWFLTQMIRWGHLRDDFDIQKTAARIYLPDEYRRAAHALRRPYPKSNRKAEGSEIRPYGMDGIMLGPNQFVDDRSFDSSDLVGYLNRQMRADRLLRHED